MNLIFIHPKPLLSSFSESMFFYIVGRQSCLQKGQSDTIYASKGKGYQEIDSAWADKQTGVLAPHGSGICSKTSVVRIPGHECSVRFQNQPLQLLQHSTVLLCNNQSHLTPFLRPDLYMNPLMP